MVTADQILNDPKYRGMSADELYDFIMRNSVDPSVFGEVAALTKKYKKRTVTEDILEYWKHHPIISTPTGIKHPYILVLRDGSKHYVCPSGESGWMAFDDGDDYIRGDEYNEDLTEKQKSVNLDIMQVLNYDGTVLWEREDKVELTLDEIADKFGISVKNLKIKK